MDNVIYAAVLIMAGLDFSLFGGSVMAEASAEAEEALRALWSLLHR